MKTSLMLRLRCELSSGESMGVCWVNFLSNCETSSSFARVGLKGGSSFFASTSSQLRPLKKACRRMGAASSGPPPSRVSGDRLRSLEIRSRASKVRYLGNFSSEWRILAIVLFRFELTKGGLPANMSNIRAPSDHQSAKKVFFVKIERSINRTTTYQRDYDRYASEFQAPCIQPFRKRSIWAW